MYFRATTRRFATRRATPGLPCTEAHETRDGYIPIIDCFNECLGQTGDLRNGRLATRFRRRGRHGGLGCQRSSISRRIDCTRGKASGGISRSSPQLWTLWSLVTGEGMVVFRSRPHGGIHDVVPFVDATREV